MRKTCNIVFISSIVLIVLSAIAPIIGFCTHQPTGSVGSGLHVLIILFSSILSISATLSLLALIFIFSLVGYLLTFGKYAKWKITNFKVLNSISDFLWLLLFIIDGIMAIISHGNHSFFITYTLISLLTLAKIIYDIYLIDIKKGAFDNNNVIEEVDTVEISEPIETDYQISEETTDNESN